MAEALAERDRIMQYRNILNELLSEASIKQERYSRQEVKFYTTIEIADLQKEIDELVIEIIQASTTHQRVVGPLM